MMKHLNPKEHKHDNNPISLVGVDVAVFISSRIQMNICEYQLLVYRQITK